MITRERKAREAIEKQLAELRLQNRIAAEVRKAVDEAVKERERHIEFLRAVVKEREQRIEILRDIADKRQQSMDLLQSLADERQQRIEFLQATAQDRRNHIETLHIMTNGIVDQRNAALKMLADERQASAAERRQLLGIIEQLTARLAGRRDVGSRPAPSP